MTPEGSLELGFNYLYLTYTNGIRSTGLVVGLEIGVDWSILIDAGRVGITIVFPVEQLGGTTIVNEKLC